MRKREARNSIAAIGNLGMTVSAVIPALYVLMMPFPQVRWVSYIDVGLIIGFLIYDVIAFRFPRRFFESKGEKEKQDHGKAAAA